MSELSSSEGLQLLQEGSDDVVVGISGFGSAAMDGSRWASLHEATGRTVYMLRYDAQTLPWPDEAPPRTLSELSAYSEALHRRWAAARLAAAGVAEHLAEWLKAWAASGRRVMLVGFSLGGAIAARAAMLAPSVELEVILISAAATDRPDRWARVGELGRLVNVFSRNDLALRYLYPMTVAADDTPAAGLGPLCVSSDRVVNLDATDRIGSDHLWASEHVDVLVRMALGCLWSQSSDACVLPGEDAPVVDLGHTWEAVRERSYRWLVAVPRWWDLLGRAVDGDASAREVVFRLDAWLLRRPDRFDSALRAGLAAMTVAVGRDCPAIAERGRMQLGGYVQAWVRQPS